MLINVWQKSQFFVGHLLIRTKLVLMVVIILNSTQYFLLELCNSLSITFSVLCESFNHAWPVLQCLFVLLNNNPPDKLKNDLTYLAELLIMMVKSK